MEKNGKEKEKNIMVIVYYLKVNISMRKGMEKEKNFIIMVVYYLKVNI